MIIPAHQAAGGQPVHPIRHGARGDQGLAEQLTRAELVRPPRAAERCQYVELPGLQAVGAESGGPASVQVVSQSADPGQYFHWTDIQVGSLSTPRVEQRVHLVPWAGHSAILGIRPSIARLTAAGRCPAGAWWRPAR